MNHIDLNLLGRELDEGIGESLNRAVHITLDDDIELFEVADCDTAAYFLKGHMLLGLDTLDADELFALVCNGLGLLLVGKHIELFTCGRGSVQTEYRYRCGRTCFGHLLSALVEH